MPHRLLHPLHSSRSRRLPAALAALLVAALVLTGAAPADASAVGLAEEPPPGPDGVVSESSPPLTLDPGPIPTGDFTDEPDPDPVPVPDAPPALVSESPSVDGFVPDASDLVDRDEFSSSYRTDDGSIATVVSAEPQNVAVGDDWAPISTAVHTSGPLAWLGIGGAEADRHPLHPVFADSAADPSLVTVTRGGHALSFTLRGAADSVIDRSAAGDGHLEYPSVFPDADLLYDVTRSGLEENIRLSRAPGSSGRASWTWEIDAGGLEAHENALGEIEFVDAEGSLVFLLPAPTMQDSSAVPGSRTADGTALRTTLLRKGARWLLVIDADRAWLNDHARVFPVLVDPTTAAAPNDHIRSYRSDGFSSYDVQLGNSNTANRLWRTVLHYDYEQFFGKQVIGAGVQVTTLYADSSRDAYGAALSTATRSGFDSIGADLGGFTISGEGGMSQDERLQNQIAKDVRDRYAGRYFTLNGDESPNTFTYKHVDTELVVWWKEYPTPGSMREPADFASHVSLTPKLAVQGATWDPTWPILYYFRVSTSTDPAGDAAAAWDSGWTSSAEVTVPEAKLQPGTAYRWVYWVADTTNGHLGASMSIGSGLRTFTTNDVPRTSLSTASPVDRALVTTTTPTLSVATPSGTAGRAMEYWFRIATGPDAKTGAVISSGWQEETTWTVPDRFLQDGTSYTWTVLSRDQWSASTVPWVGRFTVDLRITDPGPAPVDAVGPVTVNLANGNAGLRFTSPTVSTAGGPLGLSFAYNSLDATGTGLRAEYFDATEPAAAVAPFSFGGRTPVMVRDDPAIDFNWAGGSPTAAGAAAAPLVPADRFLVRWTGTLTLPAGTFYLAGSGDDGVRAWVDGTALFDRFHTGPGTSWSIAIAGGRSYALKFEYYENTGAAGVSFRFRTGTSGDGIAVPAAWLTRQPEILPAGWGASRILAGASSTYTRAEVTESAVRLFDVYGSAHSYVKKSAGGYEPPAGEYGIVALDTSGAVTFTDDGGTVYAFGKDGAFRSATSPTDVKKPTAPVVLYRPGSRLIDAVADPLSAVPGGYDRKVTYRYRGDAACTADAGFSLPPTDMLCRIEYPDGTSTRLLYNAQGQLVRIVNPGDEFVTFAYDTIGRLTQVRNALANDWLLADLTRAPVAANRVDITYLGESRMAAAVRLPAPDGLTAANRPGKIYSYRYQATFVDVVGLTVPAGGATSGHAAKVAFNALLQATSATSAEGLTAQTAWSAKDQKLWSLDPSGVQTSTLYDRQDRPTDSYGPAPSSCFRSDRVAVAAGCAVIPPHSSTRYDEGLSGLNVAYWKNEALSGPPAAFSLGLGGGTSGEFARNYLTAAPIAGVPAIEWSMRGTGLITFPIAGEFQFNAVADDALRVWLDDVLIIDNWTYHLQSWVADWKKYTATAGQTARLRIEYAQKTGPAEVHLTWAKPGAGTWEVVPGTALTPDYGLTTTSRTDDAAPSGVPGVTSAQVQPSVAMTTYASPWLGLPTTTAVDPAGLNLRSQTVYESSELYNRRIGALSPADAGLPSPANGSSYEYWATTGTPATPTCGVSTSTKQYGMLRRAVKAQPSAEAGVG
ncbi:MAG: PA14 domain-containing protein, partial [Herbiconiux sp.]|nr:PA14 domain-containing protein [Herbiconiux sp.]